MIQKSFMSAVAGIVVVVLSVSFPAAAQTDVINIIDDKVGILNAEPQASLHVTQPPGIGGATLLVQEGALEVKRTDGGSANFRYRVANPTIAQDWLFMLNGTNGKLEFRNETGMASPFAIRADAPTDSVYLAAVGVGIGTNNPAGKLDVNGTIYQRGGQIHADYVFEPDYRLESIDEHASTMWAERHLPAVPPRRLDGEGQEIVEIGSHQRGILEELEKAHIYIEQLHRRLEQQDHQIDELNARFSELQAAAGLTQDPAHSPSR